jgi:hypothetical protein
LGIPESASPAIRQDADEANESNSGNPSNPLRNPRLNGEVMRFLPWMTEWQPCGPKAFHAPMSQSCAPLRYGM